MKRKKKPTVLSIILGVLGAVALFFTLAAGSVVFAIAAVLLIVAGFRARVTESFSEYRDRYEETYGLNEPTEPEAPPESDKQSE
jgi:membrane protein implicated in regulation of membrane protease activity